MKLQAPCQVDTKLGETPDVYALYFMLRLNPSSIYTFHSYKFKKNRPGLCGAWSFDNAEGKCYLHTVDGCCGQFGKQEANSDWISGYVCPHCWSTKGNTDCPCTIKERAVIPKTAHGAGGKSPLHATSSVSKLKI